MQKENDNLTLRAACRILGIDCNTNKPKENIHCPACGSKRKTLNINFDKYGIDDGAFRCAKCDIGGRALHFWALFRGLDIYDAKGAATDYNKFMRGNRDAKKKQKQSVPIKEFKRIDVDVAPIDVRDRTYRAFLDMLQLSPSHRKDLEKRGLTKKEIEKNGYKSFPVSGRNQIANYLLANGYVLEGVPGFHLDDNNQWTIIRYPSGYLIPQKDGKGRIQGMQVRLDKGDPKYIVLSSSEHMKGSKGRTYCHLAKGKNLDDVILTEGPLKGDIICKYTGYSVLAIPGVNCFDYLLQAVSDLREKGMKKITIAFDMDLYTNIHVRNALEKLANLLASLECPFTLLQWDAEYKGLDDWLQATTEKNTAEPDSAKSSRG